MRHLFTFLGTQVTVGGGLFAGGAALLPAIFIALLTVLAVVGYRAVVRGDLI